MMRIAVLAEREARAARTKGPAIGPPPVGWWRRAACINTMDWHTGSHYGHRGATAHARAVHVCVTHCPVLAECRRDIEQSIPFGVIQAGVRWEGKQGGVRRPTPTQPEPLDCGDFCRRVTGRRGGRHA